VFPFCLWYIMVQYISFLHVPGLSIKRILPSTRLLIWMHERNTMKLHYQTSWGWALGSSKYIEYTIIKLKLYCKMCSFCWFLFHRCITMHCSKNLIVNLYWQLCRILTIVLAPAESSRVKTVRLPSLKTAIKGKVGRQIHNCLHHNSQSLEV
jgi:hypothetical protein